MGQKQDTTVDYSDLHFRSHCIHSGHFLVKCSWVFPLMSGLTSPRCNAELIREGQGRGRHPASGCLQWEF